MIFMKTSETEKACFCTTETNPIGMSLTLFSFYWKSKTLKSWVFIGRFSMVTESESREPFGPNGNRKACNIRTDNRPERSTKMAVLVNLLSMNGNGWLEAALSPSTIGRGLTQAHMFQWKHDFYQKIVMQVWQPAQCLRLNLAPIASAILTNGVGSKDTKLFLLVWFSPNCINLPHWLWIRLSFRVHR